MAEESRRLSVEVDFFNLLRDVMSGMLEVWRMLGRDATGMRLGSELRGDLRLRGLGDSRIELWGCLSGRRRLLLLLLLLTSMLLLL